MFFLKDREYFICAKDGLKIVVAFTSSYVCNECDKAYQIRQDLKLHMRKHTGTTNTQPSMYNTQSTTLSVQHFVVQPSMYFF